MSNTNASSLATQLFADLQHFLTDKTAKHVTTEQLLAYLAGIDAAPWATLTLGKVITARHLARLLQHYGIFPKTIRFTDSLAKGYTVADFADAFARSFVTDKVVDKVDVTDRIESAKGVVTDRRPVLADSVVTDSDVTDKVIDKVDVTDRKPAVAAPVPVKPARKWPPPKGWSWNHQTACYEPPTPTVEAPIDQALIRQTLHVSPHLQYVPGKGLVSIHEQALPAIA